MSNGEKSLVFSKEVWITAITLILAFIVENTGVAIPISPEQILALGIAVVAAVRIFWTKSNITSILPKKGV